MSKESEPEVLEVVAERDVVRKVRGDVSVTGKKTQIRSEIASRLCELIREDVDELYQIVKTDAVGSKEDSEGFKRGTRPKSYGNFIMGNRRMFLDLIKMANANVDVQQDEVAGNYDAVMNMLLELDDDQLRNIANAGSGRGIGSK